MAKLEVDNVAALVRYAVEHGFASQGLHHRGEALVLDDLLGLAVEEADDRGGVELLLRARHDVEVAGAAGEHRKPALLPLPRVLELPLDQTMADQLGDLAIELAPREPEVATALFRRACSFWRVSYKTSRQRSSTGRRRPDRSPAGDGSLRRLPPGADRVAHPRPPGKAGGITGLLAGS
jgi:hypothetical protein